MKIFTFTSLSLAVVLIMLVTAALLIGKALPAGERYSFAEGYAANLDVYALDLTGGVRVDLTRNPAIDYQEAWSPDGTRMAFLSDRSGAIQLYLLMIGRGGGVRLLDGEVVSATYRPVWSPDGRALVYEVRADPGDDIVVVEVDQPLVPGSNPRFLAPARWDDRYPVWSPDGKQIAFTSWRSGDAEIFVVRPDGSGLTNLTHSPNDDSSPAWSPDGEQIAFFSLRSHFRELYVMNRDGSGVRQLTDARQVADGSYWGAPVWSPDGQALAYQAVSGKQASIVVIGLDGSVKRRLINGQTDDPLFGGERLAYLAAMGQRALLYLTEADGSNPRALTAMDSLSSFAALWGNPAS